MAPQGPNQQTNQGSFPYLVSKNHDIILQKQGHAAGLAAVTNHPTLTMLSSPLAEGQASIGFRQQPTQAA